MGKGSSAPAPPDPRETAQAEAQFNRLDTYSPSGSGVRYGFTDENGQFQQGTAAEGQQAAVSTIESPWEQQIRETLQPASTDLVSQLVSDNVTNLPDAARIGDRGDIAQTIFDRNFSMMAPAIEQSNSTLIKNLQARGLPVGGEAFNDAYGEQTRQTQETLGRMAMDADIASGQEQSRLYGLEANQRGTALSEIMALMGGNYNPPSAVPSGNAAGVNYGSLVNNNYNQELQAHNQSQQQAMGTASTLGNIGMAMMKCTMHAKDVEAHLSGEWARAAMESLPLAVWRYKPDHAPEGRGLERHIGPMAEHFKEITGLGDGKTIDPIDFFGLLAGALQNALARIAELEHRERASDDVATAPKRMN